MSGPSEGTVRALADFLRGGSARSPDLPVAPAPDGVQPTRAFRRFLGALGRHEAPILLDLGSVVGPNVMFFGEHLGCKIFVEDLYADVERHARENRLDALPEFLGRRFPQPDDSVDGVLCWDVLDYLDRAASEVLARQMMRILRPGGALLGFFATTPAPCQHYTKYVIVDADHLRHRPYASTRGRQQVLQNRDVLNLFGELRVSESFLLKSNIREMLFRKEASPVSGAV